MLSFDVISVKVLTLAVDIAARHTQRNMDWPNMSDASMKLKRLSVIIHGATLKPDV